MSENKPHKDAVKVHDPNTGKDFWVWLSNSGKSQIRQEISPKDPGPPRETPMQEVLRLVREIRSLM